MKYILYTFTYGQHIISGIWFVRTIFAHCIIIWHSFKWSLPYRLGIQIARWPTMCQTFFNQFEYFLTLAKWQFNIQLGEFRLTIRFGAFVTAMQIEYSHMTNSYFTLNKKIISFLTDNNVQFGNNDQYHRPLASVWIVADSGPTNRNNLVFVMAPQILVHPSG